MKRVIGKPIWGILTKPSEVFRDGCTFSWVKSWSFSNRLSRVAQFLVASIPVSMQFAQFDEFSVSLILKKMKYATTGAIQKQSDFSTTYLKSGVTESAEKPTAPSPYAILVALEKSPHRRWVGTL